MKWIFGGWASKTPLACGAFITALECAGNAVSPDSLLPHWAGWTLAFVWLCIFIDFVAYCRVVRK